MFVSELEEFTFGEATHEHVNRRKQGYSGLKRSRHGLWMTGLKWHSPFCFAQDDDVGSLVLCQRRYKDVCLEKTSAGWCQVKDQRRWQALPLLNAHIEILDTDLIPLIRTRFGGTEVIFQDDDASCLGAKSVQTFPQERQLNDTAGKQSASQSGIKFNGVNWNKRFISFILQSWSVNSYTSKLESDWWRILISLVNSLS